MKCKRSVFHKRSPISERINQGFSLTFGCRRRDLTAGKSHRLPVIGELKNLDRNMFHMLHTVLVQGVPDKVKLPAVGNDILNFPGSNSRPAQVRKNSIQHYPSLAFVLR